MQLIGTKIQTLRRNKNMTQAQLAEVLSVSAQSVSKWENHLSTPDISMLPVIARYFGITMDELFHYRLDALNYKERFIRFMADNGVLQFGEFKLRSGRISPYFISTGNYKSAGQIYKLGEFYAECMRENNVESNLLIGNSPQEIPITIATSMVLFQKYGIDINYSIEHAVGKRLEAGDKITFIKDTLTSGDTLRANLEAMQESNMPYASDIVVSVDRMEKDEKLSQAAKKKMERTYGVKIHSIVTMDDIIHALEGGIVGNREHLENMKQYKERYGGI